MRLLAVCASLVLLLFSTAARAGEPVRYQLTIEAGNYARANAPVCVDVMVPKESADLTHASIKLADGRQLPAQVSAPSLLANSSDAASGDVPRQLCFILDKVDAGQSIAAEAVISAKEQLASDPDQFAWTDTQGKYTDLQFRDRTLLRYMYEPLDESSPDRRGETYKVYHHAFDPAGKSLLTKGPGGLFPHHRGLFYGFNKITYGDNKSADTWHCTGDAFESHDAFSSNEAGPVLGRHRVKVGWHGQQKEVFANEDREMTVYRQPLVDGKPAGTMIDFASVLKTTGGDIKLEGDPQHAGFQFRASQEVPDKTQDQTYYIRVDGVGKPGEFRNWPAQKDQVNFPWKGLSFVLGGQRYTVALLDRPENPKESRFSERDYGRFGSYFEYLITPEKPLKLNYRVWIQPGEMTPEQIAALDTDFIDPPKVTAKRLP